MNAIVSQSKPVPGSISYNSVLGWDFVTSDNVIVSAQTPGQVAVFRNPYKSDCVEALAFTKVAGAAVELQYLYQDAASLTGWKLVPVLDATGAAVQASQVIAFANTWQGVDAFYVDTHGVLNHITLDSSGWNAPEVVKQAPKKLGQLRVCYSPGATASSGTVVVYAGDDDEVFLYSSSSGKWLAQPLKLGGAASSWTLSLNGPDQWFLTIVAKFSFSFRPNEGQPIGTVQEGNMAWATGTLGPQQGLHVTNAGLMYKKFNRVVCNATQMAGTNSTMVLSLDDAADANGGHALNWILDLEKKVEKEKEGGAPHGNVAGTSFADMSVVEATDGYVNVFGVDPHMNLFTLRQVSFSQENMGTGYGNDQTFGPLFQLDQRIARMYPDASPSDAPAIIAVDADTGALKLFVMDPNTKLWMATPINLPTSTKYEITTWQTDITLYDTVANPLGNYALSITAQSAMDILINGDYHIIDSDQSATVKTNGMGKATVTSLATSMAPPSLTVAAEGLAPQAPHSPGAQVNDYLAGTGSIMGKPAFSADVVSQWRTSKEVLPQQGYQAMKQCAQMGQAAAGNAQAQATLGAMSAENQFHVYMRTDSLLQGVLFKSYEQAHQHIDAVLGVGAVWDDVWDTEKGFVGDVWHAIKRGLHAVHGFVVDLAKKTVELVIEINGQMVRLGRWLIDTVEKGLEAISAVINWIGSRVEKVIVWLRVLFDFKAIWNTKTVLSKQLMEFPNYLIKQFDTWSEDAKDFFKNHKEKINQTLDQMIKQYEGEPMTSMKGWRRMGVPPGNQPIVGGATEGDLTNNPTANWMQNKVSSRTPDSIPDQPETGGDAIRNFFNSLAEVGANVEDIFADLYMGVYELMRAEDLKSFQNICVSSFLKLVKDAVNCLMDLLETVLQGLLALGDLAMKGFKAILSQKLNLGFLNDLYQWITSKVGVEGGDFTVADLICLVAAFPITITYKLIAGVDKEPFPNGKPPKVKMAVRSGGYGMVAQPSKEVLKVFGTCAGVLTVISGAFAVWGDLPGPTPTWVGWASKGITALKLVFTHPGFLNWGPLEWLIAIDVAKNLLWLAFVLYWLCDSYNISVDKVKNSVPVPKNWGFDDVTKLGKSVFGFGALGSSVYYAIAGDAPALSKTASIVQSLAMPFDFLTMTTIQAMVPVGQIALAIKIVLDGVAYGGGGIIAINSAFTETSTLGLPALDQVV